MQSSTHLSDSLIPVPQDTARRYSAVVFNISNDVSKAIKKMKEYRTQISKEKEKLILPSLKENNYEKILRETVAIHSWANGCIELGQETIPAADFMIAYESLKKHRTVVDLFYNELNAEAEKIYGLTSLEQEIHNNQTYIIRDLMKPVLDNYRKKEK